MNKSQLRLLTYSGLGGLLEFYDFIIYALLAPVIATLFFPSEDKLTTLLATFATFSVGYLARPLGGFIFSHFGDKHGRKNTFMFTVVLMAFATFGIGITPSYQTIGILATVLIILFRILQGISVGGEIPGAITYVSESLPKQRSFATAIIFFFLVNGITVGSLLHYFVAQQLSHDQFMLWGWRSLFILGGLFGFLAFILRQKMEESPIFRSCSALSKQPLTRVFAEAKLAMTMASLMVGLGAALITVLYLFIPTYFKSILQHTPEHFWLSFTLSIFTGTLFTLVVGLICQRVNKLAIITLIALITLISALPIFKFYIHHQFMHQTLFFSCILIGSVWGVIPAYVAELFPTHIRYSGVATSYNIAFALFGGLAPVICIYLIKVTGLLYAPAFYLMSLAALVLMLCLWAWIKHSKQQHSILHRDFFS